jgi:hypothetical protein
MNHLHEDLSRNASEGKAATDRSFGLVFGTLFAAIGCYPILSGDMPRWWLLGLAVLFFARRLHRASHDEREF